MKKKIARKICAIGLISSIVLSGCGKAGITGGNVDKSADSTDKVVSLKVWTEKNSVDVMNKMLDSFKEQYKDEAQFDITIEVQADSQVRDVMLTDVHNGADVFSFPDDQIISLTAGGVLTAVPNADEIAAANVKESVEAATLNDTLYGYPMTADNGYFMYYNKDYFSEEDVKSLDKMLSIAAANNKKVAMEFDSGWYFYTFFGNTGLSLSIKPDGITNECNWNSQTGDITGISGVWDVMNVKEAWGENYGACKLPTYTVAGKEVQMSSFTGYKMMGVNAYSKNKEWACRLADWLTNQQNQELRFKEKNQGPSNSKAAESGEIKKVAAIQAIIAQSQHGTLQRVGNSYWDACKKFANTVLSGNNGGLSDQEVMDTLVNEITASAVK